MPRRAAPRSADLLDPEAHQQSPIPSSSDAAAQNLARLRSHWKWAAFSQFFYTFSHLFAMEDVSLSDIEDDLARETNIFLPRVLARLLFVLSYDRKVSLDNWQAALRKQHNRRDPASNPIGPEPDTGSPGPRYRYESVSVDDATAEPPENAADVDGDPTASEKAASALPSGSRANTDEKSTPAPQQDDPSPEEQEEQQESLDWLDLPMLTKLDSMHLLTEWQFQNPTRFRTLMKSDDEDATWRIEPIGYDAKSNAYWLIGADRLWIQRAHPKPPRYTATTSPLKRKRPENAGQSSTAKSKRPATKRARLASDGPSKVTITVPGGRAAKAQAKLKLDAQAKELAELNRAAGVKGSEKRTRGRTPVAPVRPLGTRLSARLRGDEDEWQAVPQDWLKEEGESNSKTAKTGLESDDDSISDLTELSEEAVDDAKEQDEISTEVPAAEETSDHKEDAQPDGFVEWETICVTLSDWEHIAERFEKGTHYTEKALHKVLVKQIVPVITEELREIERKRRLEEAIVHRKRSSRIANKESEKEEARMLARQKAEVAEKKNRAQRLEARLAKEEAERERREAAREQRRKDKEAQEEVQSTADDESADMVVDIVGNVPPPQQPNQTTYFAPHTSRRNGTATASTSTSGTRTPMGDDWVLNCEICHRSGVNADDGIPMLCCGICSQWQHIACHDRADVQAGRPQRNWDHVEFVCRQCQTRRVAAKNSRQHPQHAVPSSYLPQAPLVPSTSYSHYNHAPPPATAYPPREYPTAYPMAVNGAAAYVQSNMGTSRQVPSYPTTSPANIYRQPPAPSPRLSAGPSSNAHEVQQQYHGAYDPSPAQFQQLQHQQHIASNANGHRTPAYQVPGLLHTSAASLICLSVLSSDP
ncbi:hypothetical protein B0H17DRAFT_1079375 [Mycena rosella]|uniref:Zinc finger PHD-type domain-containing protein n=1 Tax=Mycena rosella TaxID=1033263 RepID=A0AAD7D3Q9_MYCRO|nr:hypothetical protein B0H17DRAFT_1079375 [Mycena rosella]